MDNQQVLLDHLAIAKTTVTLNATFDGVKLPPHLMGNSTVNLNLSNKFQLPMLIREDKVVATLSFNGMPFQCHIPYVSIFAIRLAEGKIEDAVVFEDDIPLDTKEMINLFEKTQDLDFLAFMAELKEQCERDDVAIGNIEGTNKPQ